MGVLGWSHRTVASWVIRTDQSRGLGCLFRSNWRCCCRYKVHLQWRLLSPLVRNLLSHWEILFPVQVLPCAKIPLDYFFPFNKDRVLSVRVTSCSLHCGRWEGSQHEPASSENGLLWRRELHSQTSDGHSSLWDLPLISCLLRGHVPHGHTFCLVTSSPTLFTSRDWSKSENLKLHQVNCWDKRISLLGNQCQEISLLQRWA